MNLDKRNSLWLAIQYSITILFSLITLKLNLSNFGKELFGSWILLSSLWGFGKALDFGLGTSLVKYVAEFNHKDASRLKELLSTSFVMMVLLGIIIFMAIFGIGQLIYFSSDAIFNQDNITELNAVFLILGVSFYLNYITIVIKSVFEGMSDFVSPSKISILYSTLVLLSVVIAFLLPLPMLTLAYFFLAASVVNILLYMFLFKIKHKNISISLRFFEMSLLKKIFSFSLAIQGAAIFGSLIDPLIKYLVGTFSGVGQVSVYEIARRFVSAISGLFDSTFRPILPKASILSGKKEFVDFLYGECAKLSRIGITYAGTVFGMGAIIIPLIIQQSFGYTEAVLLYFILALPESVNNFGYAIYNFLIGTENALFLVLVQSINVLIIGLSVYFGIMIFGNLLGLLGYGFTVIIVNILMMLFVKKLTGISVGKYFTFAKVHKLFILLIALLAVVLLLSSSQINLYLLIAGLSGLSTLLFIKDLKIYSDLIFRKINFRKNV
jgi:O-antigen/teichoic acid export membrane protein